mmetsp:Transcript_21815/g.49344  ORF Transcript_21815/g.49344 Transcript_21815/m.49344 type:complete len:256 (+) Transcript_21815:62-829(+)
MASNIFGVAPPETQTHENPSSISEIRPDNALLGILPKFEEHHGLNWAPSTPFSEWVCIEAKKNRDEEAVVLSITFDPPPPLAHKLKIESLGSALLTDNLICLKLTGPKIKANLTFVKSCQNLRTLVLSETKVKGDIENLGYLPALMRLNLSFSKVKGSISVYKKCPLLQTLVMSDTLIQGHIEVFEACPDLFYCKLDYTGVYGAVESFHKCPNLQTLDLRHSQVSGNTEILRFAAPMCDPREVLALHQRLDADIN